jgi:xylulokinase
MSLLGIDVGTSGCKAAAYGVGGGCIASAQREYPTVHPRPGWAELDSRLVLARVKEVIAEVASKTGHDPVTALCVSSMGEAMTPVGRDGQALANSILQVDIRGTGYAQRLEADFGREAFYAINPNIPGPNYSLPKLLWLRDNEPALFGNTWKFLLWGDLVSVMLGAEPVTSFALANRTLLFDIRKEAWSEPLLAWSGIDAARLPRPVPSGTVAGEVRADVAAELGLPAGVKIVVGAHDQCCGALGAGICTAGKAVCGMGTVECITPVYNGIPPAATMLPLGLNVEHHVVPGLYLSFLYNQSGSLVKWFRDTFAADMQGEDVYGALLREMPEAPSRLLVLPHFEMTGAPDFIADSAGVIAGLRTGTERGEILKAIIEGAAFHFVEGLDALRGLGIDLSEFIATGGGAKSAAWLQIKADIYGVPFVRPQITECGALGAAILAGCATGVFNGPAEGIALFVARDRVFEPNAARHEQYREMRAKYRQLYPAMRGLLAEL